MNSESVPIETEARLINQAKAMSLFDKERANKNSSSLKAAHAHVGSKIAKGIVAEIEANQSKNSLRIEQASLNTSSISIDSEGNNLHILLSEAGRRQIKLHLQEIDSRFQTEIGKLYIEWKSASHRSRYSINTQQHLRLSSKGLTTNTPKNVFPGSTTSKSSARLKLKDSPELQVSETFLQPVLSNSTRNTGKKTINVGSVGYTSVGVGERKPVPKPQRGKSRLSNVIAPGHKRVLKSTQLLNKSTGNLGGGPAAQQNMKKRLNQSSLTRKSQVLTEEEKQRQDDSLIRKVASNPDLHTDSSPIRVSQSYTPQKSSKKGQGSSSGTKYSTAKKKRSKIKEDTPEPGKAPAPEPRPSLMMREGKEDWERLEGEFTSKLGSQEQSPLRDKVDEQQQQLRETSELTQSINQSSKAFIDSTKMEQLILQIDKYTQRNNGRIPPALREKLNSFSQQITKHFFSNERTKSSPSLNPNKAKIATIKQNAQSKLKSHPTHSSSATRLLPTNLLHSTKSSPEPNYASEARYETSSIKRSELGPITNEEEQTYQDIEADFDKWLQLLTSRRLKELAPCIKSHKIAHHLALCIMYLICDLDKTIVLSPDKKKIQGRTWAHVQNYMNGSGKVVALLKRLKAQLVLGPKLNESLFRELKNYWNLCQTADPNDVLFFQEIFNFVRAAVCLIEFLNKTKIRSTLQAQEKRKTRSRSYGSYPRPDSKPGSFLSDAGQVEIRNRTRRKVKEAEIKFEVMNELDREEQKAEEEIMERQREIEQARLKILELQSVKNKANWERERNIKMQKIKQKNSVQERERKYQDQQRRLLLESAQEKEKRLQEEKREMLQSDIHHKRIDRLRLVVQDKKETLQEFQKTINDIEFKQKQKEEERKKKQLGHIDFLEKLEQTKKERLEKFKHEAKRAKKERLERQKQEVEWQYQRILKQREDLEKELLLLSKF